VYLAYLDDSDTKQKSVPWQVMAAVLVQDGSFRGLEAVVNLLAEELMQNAESASQFEEFHACELFGGYGAFEKIPQSKRFATIQMLLDSVTNDCPVVYGAVNLPRFQQMVYGAAEPMDVAFRVCVNGIREWMATQLEEKFQEYRSRGVGGNPHFDDMALLIADDCDKGIKATLQKSFRQMRLPYRSLTDGGMECIHDDIYFGDSKFSIGIQIADLCSFFIAKHLVGGDPAAEAFYQIIEPRIVYSREIPEGEQRRNVAEDIGIKQ